MGLIAGVVAAGVIGAGATAYAASQSASAQDNANNTNAQNVRNTNFANILMQLASRGQTVYIDKNGRPSLQPSPGSTAIGASALLPYYMGNSEQAAGGQATDTVNSILAGNGSAADQMQAIQSILAKYQPAFSANTQLANQIATGQTTQQMLSEAQPVQAATMQVAQGRKNAALESLAQTLNQIDAVQAKRGYAGDSLGQNLLKFNANRTISIGAADDLNQAMLQNALQTQSIKNTGRQLQIQDINLPNALASSDVSRGSLPGSTVASRFNTALQPYSFFNLGPHNFSPEQNLPMVQPVPTTGQIVGQGVGSLASGLGSFAANQSTTNQLTSALNSRNGVTGTGAGSSSDFGAPITAPTVSY